MLKNFDYHAFFNNLDNEYDYGDSDDDSIVNSDDESDCIKILNPLMLGGYKKVTHT